MMTFQLEAKSLPDGGIGFEISTFGHEVSSDERAAISFIHGMITGHLDTARAYDAEARKLRRKPS